MVHRPRQLPLLLAAHIAFTTWSFPLVGYAQPGGRRVATLESLSNSPIFFHGEEVIVHATVEDDGVLTYLVDDNNRLLALDVPPSGSGAHNLLEVIGQFYDVGRLEPEDPRTKDLPFDRLAVSILNKPWPAAGELPVLVATATRIAQETSAVTLRSLALNPELYLDQLVTVTGRFRGRNLYADLPQAPGESRWDFVLISANAAIWIIGREPQGQGFDLDVQARSDTGRWLEVTGSVRMHAGMVLISADQIALADPPTAPERRVVSQAPRIGLPPEVIFSAPLVDDTDVPSDTTVRIQFSRDMDPDSFQNRIKVSYSDPQRTNQSIPNTGEMRFDIAYRARNRVLEITFQEELTRFQTLRVDLLEGITATDGASLEPWALSFFVGR